MGPDNEVTCLDSLLAFERLPQDIGILLNKGKRCLPSTSQIVYRIEIDTTTMPLQLPEDKLAKAILLVDRMAKCRSPFAGFVVTHLSTQFCLSGCTTRMGIFWEEVGSRVMAQAFYFGRQPYLSCTPWF